MEPSDNFQLESKSDSLFSVSNIISVYEVFNSIGTIIKPIHSEKLYNKTETDVFYKFIFFLKHVSYNLHY